MKSSGLHGNMDGMVMKWTLAEMKLEINENMVEKDCIANEFEETPLTYSCSL